MSTEWTNSPFGILCVSKDPTIPPNRNDSHQGNENNNSTKTTKNNKASTFTHTHTHNSVRPQSTLHGVIIIKPLVLLFIVYYFKYFIIFNLKFLLFVCLFTQKKGNKRKEFGKNWFYHKMNVFVCVVVVWVCVVVVVVNIISIVQQRKARCHFRGVWLWDSLVLLELRQTERKKKRKRKKRKKEAKTNAPDTLQTELDGLGVCVCVWT